MEPKATAGAKDSLKVLQEKLKEAKSRVQTAEKVRRLRSITPFCVAEDSCLNYVLLLLPGG